MRIEYRWAAGRSRSLRRECSRTGCAGARCHCSPRRPDRGGIAEAKPARCRSYSHTRSIRSALGFVASSARPGGNVTGFTFVRVQHRREMAGVAQRLAPSVTRVAVFAILHASWDRPVRGYSGSGTVGRGRVEPDQRAQRRRDRGRGRDLCPLGERRLDRDCEPSSDTASRADHRAGGPAQASCNLFRTLSASQTAA